MGVARVLLLVMWVMEKITSVVVVMSARRGSCSVVAIRVEKSCGGFAEILRGVGVEELTILVSILGRFISGEHDR